MPAEITPFLDTMPKYIIHRHEKSHETPNLANLATNIRNYLKICIEEALQDMECSCRKTFNLLTWADERK